ncbi:MAG: class I mannose-6-phosphate isomerase [Planctomycetes bacterium]|nr:class I mannose-6-phosphate isomerase [Planctomycetota bacterium]
MLATLFHKPLPGHEPIGESWELSGLPDNESLVASGPLAGQPVSKLVELWGGDLLGRAELTDSGFPLLIKLLDARQPPSVQVHPKPTTDDPRGLRPGVKHEAWFVLHAEPGAKMFIGLKPGVGPRDVADAANSPASAALLREWPVTPGQCYYLPSGTVHALGAGLVVAEIQTPSDVTYRLYDWDRVEPDGRPRELHIEQALRNIRYDVAPEQILQPTSAPAERGSTLVERLTTCERFLIDKTQFRAPTSRPLPPGEMAVWITVRGRGTLVQAACECPFRAGDVLLLPADNADIHLASCTDCEVLEVKVPAVNT